MPIENERKYVLRDEDSSGFKAKLVTMPGATSLDLKQGYLDKANRIRSIRRLDGTVQYLFTYKTKVNGNQIEIENEISERDFNSLWTLVGNVITKTRIVVPFGDYKWEVDFLHSYKKKTLGECYLVMAEVELPEDQELPNQVPDFISENLVYLVPRDDRRFINRNLSRVGTVKQMVQELKNVQ